MIDWDYALQIGGIGFGTVFLVLIILAVAITIVGLISRRVERNKNDSKGE